jgi:hypothetical protein
LLPYNLSMGMFFGPRLSISIRVFTIIDLTY